MIMSVNAYDLSKDDAIRFRNTLDELQQTSNESLDCVVEFDLWEAFKRINRPYFKMVQDYLLDRYDDALCQDLCSIARVSRELNKGQTYIHWLIKNGHIRVYTDERLVRRSEVRLYIEKSKAKKINKKK